MASLSAAEPNALSGRGETSAFRRRRRGLALAGRMARIGSGVTRQSMSLFRKFNISPPPQAEVDGDVDARPHDLGGGWKSQLREGSRETRCADQRLGST